MPPRPASHPATRGIAVTCERSQIRTNDVEVVLGTHEPIKTVALRNGLIDAVREGCEQDVARIVVTRRGTVVTWAPALGADRAVGIALR